MKRILAANDHQFLKDGNRIFCTYITIPFKDIPNDLDLSGYNVSIKNVLYDDCRIKITGFDANQNGIILEIPKWIKEILFQSHLQSLEASIRLLEKLKYEQACIKDKVKIPYDNIIA